MGADDNDLVTLQNMKGMGLKQVKDEIIAGAPRVQHPPSLFNFEHHFDKELTPRKGWQQQVNNLNSMLEYEKENHRTFWQESLETKQSLESHEVKLASSLREAQSKIEGLQHQFEQSLRENQKLAKEAETAVAQRERDLQRFQEEKQFNLEQLHEAKDRER